MYIWKNNKLSIYDYSDVIDDLQFGYGLFETLLGTQTEGILLWAEHINRLNNAIRFLDASFEFNDFLLKQAIQNLLDNDDTLKTCRIKLIFLPTHSYLLVLLSPFNMFSHHYSLYSDLSIYRGKLPHYSYKTTSYFENLHMKNIAIKSGYDDFLFVDSYGNVLETTLANIFFVRFDGIIETPSNIGYSLLNGIIRSYLIAHATEFNIQIIETRIPFNAISSYKEVFITNSIQLLQPVISVNQFHFLETSISHHIRSLLLSNLGFSSKKF